MFPPELSSVALKPAGDPLEGVGGATGRGEPVWETPRERVGVDDGTVRRQKPSQVSDGRAEGWKSQAGRRRRDGKNGEKSFPTGTRHLNEDGHRPVGLGGLVLSSG